MDNSQTPTMIGRSREHMSWFLRLYHPRTWQEKGILWTSGLAIITYCLVVVVLGVFWSRQPDEFDVRANALAMVNNDSKKLVPGYITTTTVITIAETMLNKPGGYLSNDVTPPGVYLDNIPNWEFGVLTELRDISRALRNDFSRSQSQSAEDKDLVIAQPQFNYDSESWMLPSSEGEYRKAVSALQNYANRLTDSNTQDGQFYTRADNLRNYLFEVERRLGSLAQRLGASVGREGFDTNLAGDPNAQSAKQAPSQFHEQTPWLEIDDVFYEARGYTWALLHILRAIEVDFAPVLNDKNAAVSLKQIIRELEGAQQTLWSPMVLNGQGFGLVANHSLVMASYISRASAALGDLRALLERG